MGMSEVADDVLRRNAVVLGGVPDGPPMVFAHGFGCDQTMWRLVEPAFASTHRTIRFDYVGAGRSEVAAWSPDRYADLEGYAQDVVDVVRAVDASDAVVVAHSVSAMIAALAALQAPDLVRAIVMLGPSPCYVDGDGYRGGFAREEIDGMLAAMDDDYLGWAQQMAPVITDNPDRPEIGQELTEAFCRTDPVIARHFARTTFLSDHRDVLPRLRVPTLVVQSMVDAIAPPEVGRYVADQLPRGELVMLDTVGHCVHLSAPDRTVEAIRSFLDGLD